MALEDYKRQVQLLLSVLPELARETCFALHGGTAINLFVRNMPRLSVDVDLTYSPLEDRGTSLANISAALERLKSRIEAINPGARVLHRTGAAKLQISARGVDIKLEVNLVARGTLDEPTRMPLCVKAQEDFEAFCTVPVVPFGQLYGGKIVAALDRQHPRDLFDVKYLLENEGFSDEVRRGFLYSVLCSDRPIHEVIDPNFQDQRRVLENQFAGMTEQAFSYEEFENTRHRLNEAIRAGLTAQDREFLLSVKALKPDWSIYDFERFPAIAWKLRNLQTLAETNPAKHREQYAALSEKLGDL